MRGLMLRTLIVWVAMRNRFYRWFFGTPTQVLEMLNVAYLLLWGVAMWDDRLLQIPLYAGFLAGRYAALTNEALSVLFFMASLFAATGARRSSPRHVRLSGYALQLSSLLWLCVAANFYASYPPLNTGVLAYSVMALFCWLAGNELWRRNAKPKRKAK